MNSDTTDNDAPRDERGMDDLLHEGEREAQRHFGVEGFWSATKLHALIHQSLTPELAGYIEKLPFFFIATANTDGECDCSFRGREHDDSGQPYPLVKAIDANTLIFPDYRGNKLYNSLGNIIVNGHIGMLFIDFQSTTRIRINGPAEIIDDPSAYSQIWPLSQRYIRVTVEQVYGNCKARIPKMDFVTPDH